MPVKPVHVSWNSRIWMLRQKFHVSFFISLLFYSKNGIWLKARVAQNAPKMYEIIVILNLQMIERVFSSHQWLNSCSARCSDFWLSELTLSPTFCCGALTPPWGFAFTPPATGIFSSLMDGAMSDIQLQKLESLVCQPGNDSDKAGFYYSIYHGILHGDILLTSHFHLISAAVRNWRQCFYTICRICQHCFRAYSFANRGG